MRQQGLVHEASLVFLLPTGRLVFGFCCRRTMRIAKCSDLLVLLRFLDETIGPLLR